MAGNLQRLSRLGAPIAAFSLVLGTSPACAAEAPPLLHAPSAKAMPPPKLAVLFALKLRLPEGRGLARLLLDAGVDRDDAAIAARLAAGHLGDGLGGCDAKVEISRAMAGGFRLERVELLTPVGQTVIERREGALTIASERNALNNFRLV